MSKTDTWASNASNTNKHMKRKDGKHKVPENKHERIKYTPSSGLKKKNGESEYIGERGEKYRQNGRNKGVVSPKYNVYNMINISSMEEKYKDLYRKELIRAAIICGEKPEPKYSIKYSTNTDWKDKVMKIAAGSAILSLLLRIIFYFRMRLKYHARRRSIIRTFRNVERLQTPPERMHRG